MRLSADTAATSQVRNLFISIFYNQKDWCTLFANLFEPLAKEISSIDPLSKYVTHFSYKRGENIGITWYLSIVTVDVTSKIIDKKSIAFLRENRSKPKVNKSRINSIFKNFPVNSQHYNLHFFPFFSTTHLSITEVELLVSTVTQLISAYFSEETIDDECKFTLTLYLHLIMANCVIKNVDKTFLQKMLIHPHVNAINPRTDDYLCSFFETELTVREIINDISNDHYFSRPENKLFQSWQAACNGIIQNHFLIKSSVDGLAPAFKEMSDLITEQLGLSKNGQEMTIFFLCKCINE